MELRIYQRLKVSRTYRLVLASTYSIIILSKKILRPYPIIAQPHNPALAARSRNYVYLIVTAFSHEIELLDIGLHVEDVDIVIIFAWLDTLPVETRLFRALLISTPIIAFVASIPSTFCVALLI